MNWLKMRGRPYYAESNEALREQRRGWFDPDIFNDCRGVSPKDLVGWIMC